MFPAAPDWSRQLVSVGVTGTNGKTSTVGLLSAALSHDGAPAVSTTTLGSFLGGTRLELPKSHTGLLEAMKCGLSAGARFAVLEVTSEVLARGFAQAWPFSAGVFTNLSHDHLDAHGSAEHYLASKAQLFLHLPPGGHAILNGCDTACELISEVVPEGVTTCVYGLPSRGSPFADLDLAAGPVELDWQGSTTTLLAPARPGLDGRELHIGGIGEIFVENALAALAAATALGVDAGAVLTALSGASLPAGRFEVVCDAPHVVVDYAHSPDALKRTLATARRLCRGRLCVVFGAGGNRDREKRAIMGESAAAADRVILTSDNPRDESPADIAAQIRSGIPAALLADIELDRARAIQTAVGDAADDDVIVIAGKGHEAEQIAGGHTRAFSDGEVARAAVRSR